MFRNVTTKLAKGLGLGSSLYVLHSMDQRRQMLDKLPHQPDFKVSKEIKPDEMLPGHWQELKDDKPYEVSVATKTAFEGRYGALTHAVFAVRPLDNKKYFLFGRQSPALAYQNSFKVNGSRFATIIDNECAYTKPTSSNHFKQGSDHATLSGAEIKAALSLTEKDICKKQFFDLFRSNCVTAIATGSANMMLEADKRTGDKQEDLLHLGEMLTNSADLNLSQGICNNSTVRKKMTQATSLISEPDNTPVGLVRK